MGKGAFILREAEGISFYSCLAFEELPGLLHGFATRHGSAHCEKAKALSRSYPDRDSSESINENGRRFLCALHFHETPLITLRQIHSNRVHIIKEFPGQWNPPEGDAVVSRSENIALAVQTADCLPILFADPDTQAFAAVHSGWRGTLEEIAIHTVQEMQEAFGCDPARLLVAVGPGIRSCCFEVGPDVAEPFSNKYPAARTSVPRAERPGKFLLDLVEVLEIQFQAAGIRPENVYDLGLCTCCNTDLFFSYRAEGAHSGRMLSVIGRTSNTRT